MTGVNDVPSANDQSVTTAEDTTVAITLTATDVDGDTLTYGVAASPANGSLSGSAPNLNYTPNLNFTGSDSFTFQANDGTTDSNIATVSITVTGINNAPSANDQPVTTAEDTTVAITLTATDVDGGTLTYSVVTPPANGSLNGTAPNLSYTPNTDFHGSDSFTFQANDGTANSNIATVSITVTPVNDAPIATNQPVTTAEDTTVLITLTAGDVDGNTLTYSVVTSPVNGSLSGVAPNLNYTPNSDFNGSDSFTFQVSDGTANSNIATVSIGVMPVNDAPSFQAIPNQAVSEDSGATNVPITGVSPGPADESSQTVSLTAVSSNTGIVPNPTITGAGTSRTLSFTPAANANGTVTITVTAQDDGGTANGGGATSGTLSFTIMIASVNDPPVANDDAYSVQQNSTLALNSALGMLSNDTDLDGDALTAILVSEPIYGTLTLNIDGSFTYTPTSGFDGTDSFTYKTNDGILDSNTATVTITITVLPPTTLTVDSLPAGIQIGGEITPFSQQFSSGTTLTLGAPATFDDDFEFDHWELDGENRGPNLLISVTMDVDHTLTAHYKKSTFSLAVNSVPTGLPMTLNPADNDGTSDGTTSLNRQYDIGTLVTLTASSELQGESEVEVFDRWEVDGVVVSSDVTITVTMDADHTVTAYYKGAVFSLSVNSVPTGIPIAVTPVDNAGSGGGATPLSRLYNGGATVTLNTPDELPEGESSKSVLDRWEVDGAAVSSDTTITVTMDADHTATAQYVSGSPVMVVVL